MNVVALIPHYNHAATVGQVAQAMRAQGLPVLIVDDGSDAAAQQVRLLAPGQGLPQRKGACDNRGSHERTAPARGRVAS